MFFFKRGEILLRVYVAVRIVLYRLLPYGIIGYSTIPTLAGWIVQAGGGTGNSGKTVTQTASRTGSVVAGTAGAAAGNAAGRLSRQQQTIKN